MQEKVKCRKEEYMFSYVFANICMMSTLFYLALDSPYGNLCTIRKNEAFSKLFEIEEEDEEEYYLSLYLHTTLPKNFFPSENDKTYSKINQHKPSYCWGE